MKLKIEMIPTTNIAIIVAEALPNIQWSRSGRDHNRSCHECKSGAASTTDTPIAIIFTSASNPDSQTQPVFVPR